MGVRIGGTDFGKTGWKFGRCFFVEIDNFEFSAFKPQDQGICRKCLEVGVCTINLIRLKGRESRDEGSMTRMDKGLGTGDLLAKKQVPWWKDLSLLEEKEERYVIRKEDEVHLFALQLNSRKGESLVYSNLPVQCR